MKCIYINNGIEDPPIILDEIVNDNINNDESDSSIDKNDEIVEYNQA